MSYKRLGMYQRGLKTVHSPLRVVSFVTRHTSIVFISSTCIILQHLTISHLLFRPARGGSRSRRIFPFPRNGSSSASRRSYGRCPSASRLSATGFGTLTSAHGYPQPSKWSARVSCGPGRPTPSSADSKMLSISLSSVAGPPGNAEMLQTCIGIEHVANSVVTHCSVLRREYQ